MGETPTSSLAISLEQVQECSSAGQGVGLKGASGCRTTGIEVVVQFLGTGGNPEWDLLWVVWEHLSVVCGWYESTC